jgi:hypothetical protein
MRASLILLTLLLCACGGGDDKIERRSMFDTLTGAFSDELRGAPSAAALREIARFEQSGVAFDHPALLRVRVDENEYPSWSLTRGDFELELHAPGSGFDATDYLDALAGAMPADPRPSAELARMRKVNWCGEEIEAVVRYVSFIGDVHELIGYDLPDGRSGTRFLVFDDLPADGHRSAVDRAAFDALAGSIRCDATR